MIQITDKTQCCGCTACVSVCPQNCITMQRDGEGFAYPVVDASLCVGCDACEAVCPCQNRRADPPVPEALAVRAKDDILRLFSSSGGVFSLLSTDMLARGGAVCRVGARPGCRSGCRPACGAPAVRAVRKP